MGISISAVLLPTAVNIGTGGTPPAFLAPYVTWTWPVIGVLWAGAVAAGLWELLARQQSSITSRPVDHPRNRPNALDRVEHYVGQRFAQSLAAKARIELDLEERFDAVTRQQELIVQPVGAPERTIASNAPISEVFNELQQSMLLLGAPGAGKTTLLLELAHALVKRARLDPEQPIPVLVDLSGWWYTTERRQQAKGESTKPKPRAKGEVTDFVQWLRDELKRRYTFPHQVTDAWLEAGKLALLLDGLDEVASQHRDECVRELNSLPQKMIVPQIAVCSRQTEYDRLREQLNLQGAVCIQPLNRKQVAAYFQGAGRGLHGVRSTLMRDPELWELLDSPLMLNIMALAVQGANGEQLRTGDTTSVRRELFDAYVCEVLARRVTPPSRYTPRDTVRALWFLAMLARESWRRNSALHARLLTSADWYKCVPLETAVAVTGVFGPVALAAFTTTVVCASMVQFGLLAGAVSACGAALGTALAIFFAFMSPSGARFSPHLASAVRAGMVVGLAAGAGVVGIMLAVRWGLTGVPALVCASIIALGVAVSAGFTASVFHSGTFAAWLVAFAAGIAALGIALWIGPTDELLGGWALGLAGSAFVGSTFFGIDDFCIHTWRSGSPKIRNFARPTVLFVLAGVVVAVALGNATGAPLNAQFMGFAVGLVLSGCGLLGWENGPGRPLIGLLAFRFTGCLPPRRRDFLAYAADRSLLSRSDGEWRFVHLLVRDHLADCDPARLGARAEQRARELAGNRSRQTA
ncbi:NACHT domain-containing protein [Saccharopolyspora shandongensis]|uniref:NACHT domain-containing protein n=1 Tax=Saccharopolyspora shandongensis TaxID=418495 RepID=UPI0033E26F3B